MTVVNNEKALKIIEQQYAAFINLNEKWDFFRGLAEYAKTLEALAPTKPIIDALEKQRQSAQALYGTMNTEALNELTKSAEEITKISEKFAKQYEPVVNAAKQLHDHLNLRILNSDRLSGLNESIFEVARRLRESGLADAIKKYEDGQRKIKNIYGDYTFSPTYEKLGDEKRKVERQEQIEPWGAWQNLPVVKRLVFEPEKMVEEVKAEVAADPSLHWTLINLYGVAGEMERIRSGEASDNDVYFFRVKDFRSNVQRLHNFITSQLLQSENENILDFDPTISGLHFAGQIITISARAQSDAHDLLRTVFKDKSKLWNADEILDDWRVDVDKKTPKKKVYHAGKAVNRIVAQETKIKDFLDVTTKTVAVNKRYLPK